MTDCDFTGRTKGSKCRACGYVLRIDFDVVPKRQCGPRDRSQRRPPSADPTSCEHFIDWTDRTALATCGCAAQKKNGTPTTIAECDLHGDVTPLARTTKEGLPSCLTCRDYRDTPAEP